MAVVVIGGDPRSRFDQFLARQVALPLGFESASIEQSVGEEETAIYRRDSIQIHDFGGLSDGRVDAIVAVG